MLFRDRRTCRDQLDRSLPISTICALSQTHCRQRVPRDPRAVPAHAGQVPRFVARKPVTAVARWIRAVESLGHDRLRLSNMRL